MKKKLLSILASTLFISLSLPLCSYASSFSEFWFQDTNGTWKVQDNNGNIVKNAWLCDDAVPSNGQDIWYLIDSNGNMVSAGLVQDQTGNIYSLETSHNGYYGMLRYKSGAYDGVYLDLESSHGGSFAKIKNQEGIDGLQAIYGLTQVNIDNSNCVYTSSFRNNHKVDNKADDEQYIVYKPDGGTVDLRDYGLGLDDTELIQRLIDETDGPNIPIHGSLN